MGHSLAEARSDIVQDDIDQVVVSHFNIDIKSIDIIQVFLDSTCLLAITYLVKSPVRLVLVAIVLPNGVLEFFPSIEPMLVIFPLF